MVYGTYNYSIHGVYKPSYNWGAPHCSFQNMCFLGGNVLHHPSPSAFGQATWSLRSACGRWCRAVDAGASPHPWTRDLGAFSGPGGPPWASKGVLIGIDPEDLFFHWHRNGCPFWLTSKIFGSQETMEVPSCLCWTELLKWSSKIINLCRTALNSSGSQGKDDLPSSHAKLQEVR